MAHDRNIFEMLSPPKIRPAAEKDCPAMTEVALTSKAFWGYSDDFMKGCEAALTVKPWMIEDWQSGVVEDDGSIAGFYLASFDLEEAELQLLYVSPLAMGKGYGRALIRDASEKAVRLGYKHLRIEADPNATGFYRKMGARQIGWCRSEVEVSRELPLLNLPLRPIK
ncbi:GNAT family N-acetyltransferase [Sneathiella litorea]|uniref:GNAT family N-acetyltransferase n=1 Tax=Sneathiella litorea TaxID=2606216 RepID=A0A6L8WAX6_9PROT|nr:GNAT family N-acetyltransferase [Sneathiella litorea]MZR31849.1 GNAT family N-acetyltransferase [Sneathiella litorea]